MTTARPIWKLLEPNTLIWKRWDEGEYVIFNPASGDTHLLNSVSADVLTCLGQAPADAEALARRVASGLGIEADDAFMLAIEGLLAELDELGLVEAIRT